MGRTVPAYRLASERERKSGGYSESGWIKVNEDYLMRWCVGYLTNANLPTKFHEYTKKKIIDAFIQKPVKLYDLIKEVL